MSKTGTIFVFLWILFRVAFNTVSFDDLRILSFLYFTGTNIGIIGFVLIIMDLTKGKKFMYLKPRQTRIILKGVLTYSSWLAITEILMLVGIGAHDCWAYSAISILIISISGLWAISA